MDGITPVGLMTFPIWTGDISRDATVGGMSLVGVTWGAGALFSVALVLAALMVHWPGPALAVARRISAGVLPQRMGDRVVRLLEGVLAGLDSLRSPRRFAAVAAWSLVVWGTYAASFSLCFLAFGIEVPWTTAFLLQGLIGFGVAIPSSPGFFGPFEAVTRATLALFGVAGGRAVSYAVAYHLGTFVPITLLGLWSLSRADLRLADLRRGRVDTPPRP
jgi:uncharacterized membrane protein YbhN (UPF0104 family)